MLIRVVFFSLFLSATVAHGKEPTRKLEKQKLATQLITSSPQQEARHMLLAMKMLSVPATFDHRARKNASASRIEQIALTGKYQKKDQHQKNQNKPSLDKHASDQVRDKPASTIKIHRSINRTKNKPKNKQAYCLGGNYRALAKKAKKYQASITRYSKKYGVSHALIKAIITAESCFNAKAVSPKGAQGLMQLMPPTAKRFGVKDSFNTDSNIKAGTNYLKFLLDYYEEDMLNVIAAYNAGEGTVDKYKGIPPYKETRQYVSKVAALYKLYSQGKGILTKASVSSLSPDLAKTIFIPRALPKSRFSPYKGRARNIEHGQCANRTGSRLRKTTRVEGGDGIWQRIYVVRHGDTLMRVMQRTGIHKNKIMQMNGLRSRSRLKAGQELLVWECRK